MHSAHCLMRFQEGKAQCKPIDADYTLVVDWTKLGFLNLWAFGWKEWKVKMIRKARIFLSSVHWVPKSTDSFFWKESIPVALSTFRTSASPRRLDPSLHTHLDSFKCINRGANGAKIWIQFKCINRGANGARKWRQDSHTSTEVQIATLSIGRGADICLISVVREIWNK